MVMVRVNDYRSDVSPVNNPDSDQRALNVATRGGVTRTCYNKILLWTLGQSLTALSSAYKSFS